MISLVPDEFRDEVAACTQQDLDALRIDTRALAPNPGDKAKLAGKLVEAGWSPEFASWYAGRAIVDADVELRLTEVSNRAQALADYDSAKARKDMLTRNGWLLFLGSIVLRVLLGAVLPEGDASIAPALIGTVVSIGLWFKGLFMVLQAKGQSPWYAILGIFIVFVPDRNILTKPADRSANQSPGGALSNW